MQQYGYDIISGYKVSFLSARVVQGIKPTEVLQGRKIYTPEEFPDSQNKSSVLPPVFGANRFHQVARYYGDLHLSFFQSETTPNSPFSCISLLFSLGYEPICTLGAAYFGLLVDFNVSAMRNSGQYFCR